MGTDEQAVAAWEQRLQTAGQWRTDMRALLEAHQAYLPHPEELADWHGFADLRPDRPFPSDELPAPDAWLWETDDDVDEQLHERVTRDGFIPLRHYGCGEYDILIVTGANAGEVWNLTDVGVGRFPETAAAEHLQHQLGWREPIDVPDRPPLSARPDRASRDVRRIEKLISGVRAPGMRMERTRLDADTVRVSCRRDGVIRNVDIRAGQRRKTYDARVHTFPVGQHRHVQTSEHPGLSGDELRVLLTA